MEDDQLSLGHVTLEMPINTSKWRYQVRGWRETRAGDAGIYTWVVFKAIGRTLLNSRAL